MIKQDGEVTTYILHEFVEFFQKLHTWLMSLTYFQSYSFQFTLFFAVFLTLALGRLSVRV